MTKQRRAEWLLLQVAIVWGSTFIVVKEAIPDCSAAPFTTIRFIIASLVGWLYLRNKLETPVQLFPRSTWWQGFVLALLFAIGYLFQTYGLAFTTVTKSAFITGMLVVLVPFAQIIVLKKGMTLWQLFGVVCCFVGLWVFTQPESLTDVNVGDVMTLLGSLLWSFYIVYINKFVESSEDMYQKSLQLTIVQFFLTVPISGLFWLIEPYFFSNIVAEYTTYRSVVQITPVVIGAIVYTAIVASVVATYIQTVYQPKTSPITASVIFSIEPIVAAILFCIVSQSMLSSAELYGSLWILGGICISQFGAKLFSFQR
jgi:drug/metabolite transporter (DMT)-like permease